MSKNPLFMLVGTFYRSFQRLYIINLALNLTHHRNFFETFLLFIHFQSFIQCIKKGHPCVRMTFLCRGYISNVIRLILPPLFCIITAKAFITEYNGGILGGWAAP